jgi:hypothetical protein
MKGVILVASQFRLQRFLDMTCVKELYDELMRTYRSSDLKTDHLDDAHT